MPTQLCALKIGEHVWKVVSREVDKGSILVERVARYVPDKETHTFELDTKLDCGLVFCYVRTNSNSIREYGLVDAGRMVKEDGNKEKPK